MMGSGKKLETLHQVTISKSFYIQSTEVTQGQWKKVMHSNPSEFKDCGDNCPVENVSWNDIQVFIRKLNSIEGGGNYRLPTEAEWEYAARSGGKDEQYSGGDNIEDVAWYYSNSKYRPHAVGQKKPNDLGIYDMSGNVWEWCQDGYKEYSEGSVTDTVGPLTGSSRILRGGSYYERTHACRTAERQDTDSEGRFGSCGFRLLRMQ
jgi:formylglycine-generating enzyme required for sulfatase activity